MPQKFAYKAFDSSGQNINGIIEEDDQQSAIEKLKKRGHLITEIKVKNDFDLKKLNFEINTSLPKKELSLYCSQFATMLQAGLPLLKCLDVLAVQSSKKILQDTSKALIQELQQGKALSEAMTNHPKVFPDFMISIVEAGEMGGVLDQVLERLAKYYQRESELRQKVITAMTYPAIIILMAIAVVVILLNYVLPQFTSVFKDLGGALPLPTRIVLGISDFMRNQYLIIIVAIAIFALVISRFLISDYGRKVKDSLSLKLPLFSDLNKKLITTNFCLTLSTLLTSGVPLIKALETINKLFKNYMVIDVLNKAKSMVRDGKPLAEPLGSSNIFPPMVIQMIGVGEETGMLEKMLEKVADIYNYEVEQALLRLTALIEPVFIVILALIVGFILVSVLLPMYSMGTLVK